MLREIPKQRGRETERGRERCLREENAKGDMKGDGEMLRRPEIG